MATSFVITVKSGRSVADLARYIRDTTDPRQEALLLRELFKRLASGDEPGSSFTVQTSANAPVQASGTVTLTYASIADSDTVTILGSVLTCVTGTPTTAQFKKQTNAATTAANLAAAINAHATLSLLVSAAAASGVVTVTALANGAIGNQGTLATSNSSGFGLSAANLANGAGGAETTTTSYSRGL
jgi:phage tail sheath gpL-like